MPIEFVQGTDPVPQDNLQAGGFDVEDLQFLHNNNHIKINVGKNDLLPNNPIVEKGYVYTIEGQPLKKEDCIEVSDGFISQTSKLLQIDEFTGKLEYKPKMKKVIVDIDYTTTPWKLTWGLSRISKESRTLVLPTGEQYITNKKTIDKNPDIAEDINSGLFFLKDNIQKGKYPYYEYNNIHNKSIDNSAKDLALGIKTSSYRGFEGKQYTFGIEAETFTGTIHPYLYKENDLNWQCVYDGSLKTDNGEALGGEYISGILKGDTGITQLEKMFYELAKRCTVNRKCSIHVHIGNLSFNNSFMIHMYELCRIVQDEMFQLLPISRRNNVYCKMLPDLGIGLSNIVVLSGDEREALIKQYFNCLFTWCAYKGNKIDENHNRHTDHPLGQKCGYNKDSPRYSWINFIPALFDTRRSGWKDEITSKGIAIEKKVTPIRTLEFRPHSGTTSFNKTLMWIKICMGIVYFAENHEREIQEGGITLMNQQNNDMIAQWKNISLESIIMKAYPRTYQGILTYITERKNKFSKSSNSEGVKMEDTEYKKVSIDKIKHKTIKEIICV